MANDLTVKTVKWLMIADAHLICADDEPAFFKMLAAVSCLPPDVGIIFLGDIFDLWIAYPGYETPVHQRFLDWCRTEKSCRAVIFLEGNHEFFVGHRYRDAFTYCSEYAFRHNAFLCLHGDRVNRKDWTYAILRFLLRSLFTRFLLKISGYTIGPIISHRVRERLRTLNQKHKQALPEAQIRRELRGVNPETQTVFAGHFHSQYKLTEGTVCAEILPAYMKSGEMAFYNEADKTFQIAPFEQLIKTIHKD